MKTIYTITKRPNVNVLRHVTQKTFQVCYDGFLLQDHLASISPGTTGIIPYHFPLLKIIKVLRTKEKTYSKIFQHFFFYMRFPFAQTFFSLFFNHIHPPAKN